MLTLKAFEDNQEKTLPCLGTLRPLEDEPSKGVRLTKQITVESIGSYKKVLHTPMYKKNVLARLSVTQPNWSFDPTSCTGVLCASISIKASGYVVRTSGAHRFCLPLYPMGSFSSSYYRVVGYMVTDDGFVAVAKRRTLLWCLLGLLTGSTFVLSYLIFRYGAEGALPELARFLGGLLP